MKSFESFTLVRTPPDVIWTRLRDHLPDIARSLDDLHSIEVLERQVDADGCVRCINRWHAKQTVPTLLRSSLGGHEIHWLDRATWDQRSLHCHWSIEPSLLTEHIQCSGSTRYESAMAGRGTRVTFKGEFQITPGFLSGASKSLEPTLLVFVESIVASVIPRSLSRAVNAAA